MKGILSLFLIYALFVTQAFGAIPFKPQTDEMILGKGANGQDKQITFDVGDGGSNPSMVIDDILKNFVFNKDLSTSGNVGAVDGTFSGVLESQGSTYKIGDGTNQDLEIQFDMNGTADIPAIKYEASSGELKFKAKVGANYKKFGSGSGSGGGENFNNAFTADDNANAEDGATVWSNSGGTFAATSTDPLEGEQSFTYTPSAQNDYVQSAVLNVAKDVFYGQACEARIEYIGGDENLSLQVINGNNTVIAEEVIPAHDIFGQESVFFLCPSAADIGGDANLGNLRYRIANTGASAAPLIKWDKSYLGTLRGLTETTLPDEIRVGIDCSGSSGIDQEPGTGITISNISGGVCSLNYSSLGLTVPPRVLATDATGAASPVIIDSYSATSTTVNVRCKSPAGATCGAFLARVSIKKSGADAKQSVQVYKSIPKLVQNENVFSAWISSAGIVSNENVDWIDGNCVATDTGFDWTYSCTYVSELALTQQMSCTVSIRENTEDLNAQFRQSNTGGFVTSTEVASNSATTPRSHMVVCQKSDADFRKGKTQNISLAGIAVNSYAETSQKQVRIESCRVNNNGTATISSASGLCESWVDSVNRVSVGTVDITLPSGIFSQEQNCVCTPFIGADGNRCNIRNGLTTTSIRATTVNNAGSLADLNFTINCMGAK